MAPGRAPGRKDAKLRVRHCGAPPLLVSSGLHDSQQGDERMKRLSTALAAAGLAALAACGGSATNNAAASDNVSDTFNVAPDDLTANDLAGNEADNAADANASARANASGNAQ
jgi:hypothetical protein